MNMCSIYLLGICYIYNEIHMVVQYAIYIYITQMFITYAIYMPSYAIYIYIFTYHIIYIYMNVCVVIC